MAFNQGTNLLGLRNKRRKEVLGNHKILEGFDNPPDTPQSYSSCGADSGKPRYGWCPPTPSDRNNCSLSFYRLKHEEVQPTRGQPPRRDLIRHHGGRAQLLGSIRSYVIHGVARHVIDGG